MLDENVNKFCKLIAKINTLNDYLEEEYKTFYYGGYSFEKCYEIEFKELQNSQNELKEIIKKLNIC